ncbi:MAG TPA: VOC family protein [Pseudonocardia sp.]|nr:VOC family protein [Pseudonocardia sp.]
MASDTPAPVTPRIGNVLHPVGDVAAAVEFYGSVLGFATKFVDGQRYAALDAGGVTLALAAPEEDVAGVAAASVKVPDVEATVKAIVSAGGIVVREPEAGPHEVRAVVRDPWDNTFVVYGPLPA